MAESEPTASTPLVANNGNGNGGGVGANGGRRTCESAICNWCQTLPQRGHKFWLTVAALFVGLAFTLYLLSITFGRSRGRWRLFEPRPLLRTGPMNQLIMDDGSIPAPMMSNIESGQNRMVLIDTDAGVDDAWALLILLRAHQDPNFPLTIVGITAVEGNTQVNNVVPNVVRVLEMMNEEKIPVYKGASAALLHPLKPENQMWHGKDGFGDAVWDKPIGNHSYIKSQPAAAAIIELAEKYKNEAEKLTILTIGPLTNLAMAFQLQPKLNTMLKEVFFLGGNYEAVGNIKEAAEFNVYADAEAAAIFFDNIYPVPFHVAPLEILFFNQVSYEFRTETLGIMKTKEIEFLNKIETMGLNRRKDRWFPADTVAAALLLDYALVANKSESFWATIELEGTWTRGMVVVEKREWSAHPPNVNFTTKINMDQYKQVLMWAAGGPDYRVTNVNLLLKGI